MDEFIRTPRVKISASFPLLDNGYIYLNKNKIEMDAKTLALSNLSIPIGTTLRILEEPEEDLILSASIGQLKGIDFNTKMAEFYIDTQINSALKEVIADIIKNPKNYELYAKVGIDIGKDNGFHIIGGTYFLKNKEFKLEEVLKQRHGVTKDRIDWIIRNNEHEWQQRI